MVWILEIRARTKPVSSLCAAVQETSVTTCRRRQSARLLWLGLVGQSEVTPRSHVVPPQ